MKKLEYQVRFNTPAFLGNAEQKGQWRTPPFKALLRQWWRVVRARGLLFNVNQLRIEEGKLFGAASDNHGASSSKASVRVRLNQWSVGKLTSWQGMEQGTIHHPEAQMTNYNVGPHAYLGYGPLDGRGGTRLKANAAIQAGENALLSLAAPDADIANLTAAISLMHHYGTLGGRSRNGWGSISFNPQNGTPALSSQIITRPWKDALQLDWPHALGLDDAGMPLIWQTEAIGDWKSVMKQLAVIKIKFRTHFPFHGGNNAHRPESRHWISHPVTRHNVRPWRNGRLPNSLRFKVRPDEANPGKLRGIIFHVPALPPADFNPDRTAIEETWEKIHSLLDDKRNGLGLERISR